MEFMRYATAVRRLRQIAEDAHHTSLPGQNPLVTGIYTFGAILDATDTIDAVDIAVMLDTPADELT